MRRAEIRNATLRDNARASKSNRCHVNCDLSVTASDRCSHVVICCDHILLLVVAGRCWLCLDLVWFATDAVSDYKFFLGGAR